VIDGENENDEI